MRRGVMWLMVLVLLAGGLTACGADGNDGGGGEGNQTTTTAQSAPGSTGSKAGGNAAITKFCDAVQQYVDKAGKLQADPSNSGLKSEVTKLGMDVGTQGGELAGRVPSFSAAENERFQACETKFTTASVAFLGG